jgi:hypothetical protein
MKTLTLAEKIRCMEYFNEILPNDREEALWYRIHIADRDENEPIEEFVLRRMNEMNY